MAISRYTTLPVRDLPFPQGLGKMEYPALEREMRQLLGARYDDPAANEELFWTPQYQELIRLHLKPRFDEAGDISVIAGAAAATARTSTVFGQPIAGHGYEAYSQYIVGMPAWTDEHSSIAAREAARWAHHPPRLFLADNQTLTIEDGKHRLSVLRSEIQQAAPDIPVLVLITQS